MGRSEVSTSVMKLEYSVAGRSGVKVSVTGCLT